MGLDESLLHDQERMVKKEKVEAMRSTHSLGPPDASATDRTTRT